MYSTFHAFYIFNRKFNLLNTFLKTVDIDFYKYT